MDHSDPSHGGFWGGKSSDQGSSPRGVCGRSERPEQKKQEFQSRRSRKVSSRPWGRAPFLHGRRNWAAGRTRLNFCFGGAGSAATERGRRGRESGRPSAQGRRATLPASQEEKRAVNQETAKSTRAICRSRNARDPRTFMSSRAAGAREDTVGKARFPLGRRKESVTEPSWGPLSNPFRRWCIGTRIRGLSAPGTVEVTHTP